MAAPKPLLHASPPVEDTEIAKLKAACITPGACREFYEFGRKIGRRVVAALPCLFVWMNSHVFYNYVCSGKFGTVREAKCRRTSEAVAIKSIRKGPLSEDVSQLVALLNEIAILKKVIIIVNCWSAWPFSRLFSAFIWAY